MRGRYRRTLWTLLLILLVAACNESLRPIEEGQLATPSGTSLESVKQAITRAANNRGWTVKEIEPGQMDAEINVRNKHYVKVLIEYDKTSYSIHYRDSKNMGYNGVSIHWKYHDWVNNLKRGIKLQMDALS